MIRHIVLLKWKAGTTDAQVDHVFAQAEELVDGIDGVERITLGVNRGEADHGFTHAFIDRGVVVGRPTTSQTLHPHTSRYGLGRSMPRPGRGMAARGRGAPRGGATSLTRGPCTSNSSS